MGIDFCNETEKHNLKLLFNIERDMDIKPLYTYLCPIIIFICFFSIIFNAILMSISRQSKVVNKSPILLLSLNLAVTDLIASTLNGLSILLNSYLPEVYDINMSQCVMLVFEIVRCAALVASALHLLALAFVHYRGIVNPLHYRSTIFFSQHLSRTINMVSIACWIIPLTIMTVWFFSSPCQGFQTGECDYLFLLGFTYRYTILTLFALPLLLMSAIYLRIFIIISRHQKGRRLNHERSTLSRGVTGAPSAVGTAAAVNLMGDPAGARCAACAAQALLEEGEPTISVLSADSSSSSIVVSRPAAITTHPSKTNLGGQISQCDHEGHLSSSSRIVQVEVSNPARVGLLAQWSQPSVSSQSGSRLTNRGTSVDDPTVSGHSIPPAGTSSKLVEAASDVYLESSDQPQASCRAANQIRVSDIQGELSHLSVVCDNNNNNNNNSATSNYCDKGDCNCDALKSSNRNLVFFMKASDCDQESRERSARRPVGKTVSLAEPAQLHQRRFNRLQMSSVRTAHVATGDRQQGSACGAQTKTTTGEHERPIARYHQRKLLIRQATDVLAQNEGLKCTCDSKTRASQSNKPLARANTIGERGLSSSSRQLISGRALLPLWAANKSLINSASTRLRVSSSLGDRAKPLLLATNKCQQVAGDGQKQPQDDEMESRLTHHQSLTTNLSTNSSRFEPQRRHLHAAALPQTNTKALVTTLLILGTYFISYVPAIIYQVLTCIDDCPYPLYKISYSRRVLLGAMTTLLLIAKSIIDPFIYSYRMSEIQVAINRYLSKRRSKSSMVTSMQASQRHNTTGYHMSSINYNQAAHHAGNKSNNHQNNNNTIKNNSNNNNHSDVIEKIQNTSFNTNTAQADSSVKILNDVDGDSAVNVTRWKRRSGDIQSQEARDCLPKAPLYSITGHDRIERPLEESVNRLSHLIETSPVKLTSENKKKKKKKRASNDNDISKIHDIGYRQGGQCSFSVNDHLASKTDRKNSPEDEIEQTGSLLDAANNKSSFESTRTNLIC